jgi:replicative DNA helicase
MSKQSSPAGKLPPHDLDSERAVLGAVMIDPDAVVQVAEVLRPEHFYEEAHRQIYQAMQDLFENRQPIDVVTLTAQLKKMKQLSAIGGASTIAELSNSVSTAANVKHYAQIVKDSWVKRSVITISSELTTMAFDEGKEALNLVDTAEQQIFALSQNQMTRNFTPIKIALAESFERLDELQRNSGELRGVPTGFADVDNLLAGLQKSNLVILAARPGVGKTAFALNIAQFAAVTAKKKNWLFLVGNE